MSREPKVVRHEFDRIVRTIRDFSEATVDVGVLDDPAVAEYAAHNEFGAPRANVPARPFLRTATDEAISDLGRVQAKIYSQAILGRKSIGYGMDLLGRFLQARVRAKIESGVGPPNAPSTIRRKGHGDTLRETRVLIDSITYEVKL